MQVLWALLNSSLCLRECSSLQPAYLLSGHQRVHHQPKRASLFNTTVRTDNRPEVSHSDVEWRAVQQQWAAVKATDLLPIHPVRRDLSECKVPEKVVENARKWFEKHKGSTNPDWVVVDEKYVVQHWKHEAN